MVDSRHRLGQTSVPRRFIIPPRILPKRIHLLRRAVAPVVDSDDGRVGLGPDHGGGVCSASAGDGSQLGEGALGVLSRAA